MEQMHEKYGSRGSVGMSVGQGTAQAVVPVDEIRVVPFEQGIDDGESLVEFDGIQILIGNALHFQEKVACIHGASGAFQGIPSHGGSAQDSCFWPGRGMGFEPFRGDQKGEGCTVVGTAGISCRCGGAGAEQWGHAPEEALADGGMDAFVSPALADGDDSIFEDSGNLGAGGSLMAPKRPAVQFLAGDSFGLCDALRAMEHCLRREFRGGELRRSVGAVGHRSVTLIFRAVTAQWLKGDAFESAGNAAIPKPAGEVGIAGGKSGSPRGALHVHGIGRDALGQPGHESHESGDVAACADGIPAEDAVHPLDAVPTAEFLQELCAEGFGAHMAQSPAFCGQGGAQGVQYIDRLHVRGSVRQAPG